MEEDKKAVRIELTRHYNLSVEQAAEIEFEGPNENGTISAIIFCEDSKIPEFLKTNQDNMVHNHQVRPDGYTNLHSWGIREF